MIYPVKPENKKWHNRSSNPNIDKINAKYGKIHEYGTIWIIGFKTKPCDCAE
jgi:hypothetical protein